MNHPDYAWSPDYYVRPQGIDGEPHVCREGRRQRTGPYPGKPHIFILTSNCQCGRIVRAHEDISWTAFLGQAIQRFN